MIIEDMNLAKVCPDLPDDWKGGISAVARILGDDKPISRTTVRKYVLRGRSGGGADAKIGANGRIQISGKEVKRLWSIL